MTSPSPESDRPRSGASPTAPYRVVRKRTVLRDLDAAPSARRVRATKDGTTVVSTLSPLLIREPGKAVSLYAVPRADVDRTLLVHAGNPPTGPHLGATEYYDLVVDGVTTPNAAWVYPRAELADHLGLAWDAFDHWYEEAEEVFVHPRGAHRADALPSSRRVRVSRDGVLLAETSHPVVLFEGSLPVRYYIPAADIRWELLEKSALTTGCPYKGWASYWSLPDPSVPDGVLWGYPDPLPEVAAVKDHWAFFNEHVDIEVDGVAQPRPVTQWTHGLRGNQRGGGSGALQQVHNLDDHSRAGGGSTTPREADPGAGPGTSHRHPVPEGEITWEPSSRWVRGLRGGTTVVDSKQPRLVWEPGRAVPCYVFPAADVRTDLLAPAAEPPVDAHAGSTVFYDLTVDGDTVRNAAWSYPGGVLGGHIGFEWFRPGRPGPAVLDQWSEENEEIFGHPRDPYQRVDALSSDRTIRVEVGGQVLAESSNPVALFETRLPTRYYLPREDVNWKLLEHVDLETRCPYKGVAEYWSLKDGDEDRTNVVWSYPDPLPSVEPIRDLVAFYNEFVDIYVDGVLEERPVSEFSRR